MCMPVLQYDDACVCVSLRCIPSSVFTGTPPGKQSMHMSKNIFDKHGEQMEMMKDGYKCRMRFEMRIFPISFRTSQCFSRYAVAPSESNTYL